MPSESCGNLSHVTQGPAICTAILDPALRGRHVTAGRRRRRDFLVATTLSREECFEQPLGVGRRVPPGIPAKAAAISQSGSPLS